MNTRKSAPVVVLISGFLVAGMLIATGPKVEPRSPESIPPLVRILTAQPQRTQLRVSTHGTVVPRTESELVPEVSGRVLWVSPALVSGGFFQKGDPLLRIDTLDYDVALEQGRARVTRAESDLANARTSHSRQMDLSARQAASDAQRDDAINRLRVAEASKREADATLARAKRDLERTTVSAPYDGRVRTERVDVGQFVNRGATVATIFAIDFAEVRLPIPDDQLAYLDLPLVFEDAANAQPANVILRARFAGRWHEWQGEVARTDVVGGKHPAIAQIDGCESGPSPDVVPARIQGGA